MTSDPRTPSARRPDLEIVASAGHATPEELAAIEEALVEAVEEERHAHAASLWLRSARAQGRRLGMYDYRDRFQKDDAWRLSVRMPAGGREYPGKLGRGDTR